MFVSIHCLVSSHLALFQTSQVPWLPREPLVQVASAQKESPVKTAIGTEPALQWGTNSDVVREAIFKLRLRK